MNHGAATKRYRTLFSKWAAEIYLEPGGAFSYTNQECKIRLWIIIFDEIHPTQESSKTKNGNEVYIKPTHKLKQEIR
jgi:hypothetical protein